MPYTDLPSGLHSIADAANRVIKARLGLPDAFVEQEIASDIPLRPTLHWKTKTHFIACEVAERPFPVSIKTQFADIVATGQPIRLLVAYPSAHGLSHEEFRKDTRLNKQFGVGFAEIQDDGSGTIEYPGVSLTLHMPPINLSQYASQLRPAISDAFEQYMLNGNPRGGIQELGQTVEHILYNTAREAKRNGKFSYGGFNPPAFINQSVLIDQMIAAGVINVPILGRCRDFANDRNAASHAPTSRRAAKEAEDQLKENFYIGTRILLDLPDEIRKGGYRLKVTR